MFTNNGECSKTRESGRRIPLFVLSRSVYQAGGAGGGGEIETVLSVAK